MSCRWSEGSTYRLHDSSLQRRHQHYRAGAILDVLARVDARRSASGVPLLKAAEVLMVERFLLTQLRLEQRHLSVRCGSRARGARAVRRNYKRAAEIVSLTTAQPNQNDNDVSAMRRRTRCVVNAA